MKSIFTNIYENCVWGDNEDDRYSGSSGTGSSVYYNREYIEFLRKFIIDNEVKSVVDLGCGDFRCGEAIYSGLDVSYTGYDAYSKLPCNHITMDFFAEKEKIIDGDLCILKDVLQHWDCKSIYTFLDFIVHKFKWILIVNCSYQLYDNQDIECGDFRPLNNNKFPLKKYGGKTLLKYNTKEVVLLSK